MAGLRIKLDTSKIKKSEPRALILIGDNTSGRLAIMKEKLSRASVNFAVACSGLGQSMSTAVDSMKISNKVICDTGITKKPRGYQKPTALSRLQQRNRDIAK